MKNLNQSLKKLLALCLFAGLNVPMLTQAANVLLANKPLVDSSTSDVLPNLMFILDNSGSMGQDWTPDWANSGRFIWRNNPDYNTQYYNPNIRYIPAVNYDGTSRGDQPANAARNDAFIGNATSNLVGNARYFSYVAGEYCTTRNLNDCVTAVAPSATHPFSAPIRWCNSGAAAVALSPAINTCRAVREDAFTNLRSPSSTTIITFTGANNAAVNSIKLNGKEIMADSTAGAGLTSSNSTLAQRVRDQINACTNNFSGNCQLTGYSATQSGSVTTIISPYGTADAAYPTFVYTSGLVGAASAPWVVRTPGSGVYVNIVAAQTYPAPGKTVAGPDRTDCAINAPCTYNQEITNYANWFSYYRTRMLGMKSSASLAFKGIDSRYRVGFITINDQANNYEPIAKFELGVGKQKDKWYTRLFATQPGASTPLRSALSMVGRIYAGKKPVGTADPVEYACQQNYALLTTDGYWNGGAGTDIDNNLIGNLDGNGTPRPLFEGGTATSNSLSDVSKYYYDTDIRTTAFNNCNGALGQNVCGEAAGEESIKKQEMTTLTLGLGIDGTLLYSGDYKNQASGDFADLKTGAKNWPDPIANGDGERIDDLWHAAVNGNGSYFSAKNPKELTESLRKALSDIKSIVGAGSAAAASSQQPVAGSNFNYVASYATAKWIGNLEARTINLATLETSEDAVWCAENIATDTCAVPATLVSETVSGSSIFYCKTPSSNASDCSDLGGNLVGTDCKVEVATSCVGTMASKVGASTDTRSIKFNAGGSLTEFNYSNLSAAQKSYFETPWLAANLSQWADLTTGAGSQQDLAKQTGIVNYLRGQTGLENRPSNPATNQIFRYREATLGDITESQPAFVSEPTFNYTDPGYSNFKTTQNGRLPVVYVGANDGMLHAFNANTGNELWAFVPTPAIPKMWKLADRDYAISHVNLVNGDPQIYDFCASGCSSAGSAVWKTILVGGLSGGGRGYYALDITNPTSPVLLWEYTAQNNANLGYTYGAPVVTKLSNGTWVVLISSGFNNGTLDNDGVTSNSPSGNGSGNLYVLNANTGAVLKTFNTGAGSPATPSGLSQLSAYIDVALQNNLATHVYGGDLLGNIWRFDINAASGATPLKLATLAGPTGLAQPITTKIELGQIKKKRVLFVGTGKYLEVSDLSNTDKQGFYAIKDDNLSVPLGNPRGSLVPQSISTSGDVRSASNNTVDFSTGLGWRLDFPDTGERMNIDPYLINGVVLAPTIVPSSTSCKPGGYGWFNYFNYKTGGAVPIAGGIVSEKLSAPAVGFNVLYDSAGNPKVSVTLSNDPDSNLTKNSDIAKGGASRTTLLDKNPDNTYGKKSIWRELIR